MKCLPIDCRQTTIDCWQTHEEMAEGLPKVLAYAMT